MNRDQLLAGLANVARASIVQVDVPEWGGAVFVRALTVAEVDADNASITAEENAQTRLARSACKLLCDAEGNRLLDANNPDDVAKISAQPWALLQRLLAAANRLNGTGPQGEAEAKND